MVKRWLILLSILFLFPCVAGAAVAHDHSTTSFTNGSTNTLTFSFTAASVSNGMLTLCVAQRDNTMTLIGTAPTFNGTPLTRVGLSLSTTAGIGIELWRLLNPAATTANIVLTSSNTAAIAAVATLWTGVHQTTPTGTAVAGEAANSVNPSVVVTSAATELVMDCLGVRNGNLEAPSGVGAGQTQRAYVNGTQGTSNDAGAGVSTEGGAASTTMSWTAIVGSGNQSVILGVGLKPAAAAAARRRGMLFVYP